MCVDKWTVLFILSLGCGGNGTDEMVGTGTESGVSSKKKIRELPEKDRKAICLWRAKVAYEQSVPESCAASGVYGATRPADCERIVDECLVTRPQSREHYRNLDIASCEDITAEQPVSCPLTVAEVEQCVRDLLNERSALYRTLTCSRAGENEPDSPMPLSCRDFDDSCWFDE